MRINKDTNKANPHTYKQNIIRIITGNQTIHPSYNKCKVEFLTPETFLSFENKNIGNQDYQSFTSIAHKHDISTKTVISYYNGYNELRQTNKLTEENIMIYLNSHNISYPLLELPSINEPPNLLNTILEKLETQYSSGEQQAQLMTTLIQSNQSIEHNKALVEQQLAFMQSQNDNYHKEQAILKQVLQKIATLTLDSVATSRRTQALLEDSNKATTTDTDAEELEQLRGILCLHLDTYERLRNIISEPLTALCKILSQSDDDLSTYTSLCNERKMVNKLFRFIFDNGDAVRRQIQSLDNDYDSLRRILNTTKQQEN